VWQALQRWLKTFLASTTARAGLGDSSVIASAAHSASAPAVVRRQRLPPIDVGNDAVPCWPAPTNDAGLLEALPTVNARPLGESVIGCTPVTDVPVP
jgi:hypothetical protein